MPTILWNEASPADSDNAGQGDDAIRSLKTSIRVGLDSEHVWPSGGGDAGVHRLGSARVSFGAQSLVSSNGTDGRLMVTSDTSNLFHVGSAGTMFLGGQRTVSAGSAPVGGQRFFWATEFGNAKSGADGTITVTIPNSGYSGVPFVVASVSTTGTQSSVLSQAINIYGKTATAFTVTVFDSGGAQGANKVFDWMSFGTRTL